LSVIAEEIVVFTANYTASEYGPRCLCPQFNHIVAYVYFGTFWPPI